MSETGLPPNAVQERGTLKSPAGDDIAWIADGPMPAADAQAPCGFFWLGGFMSDMSGSKATALAALANATRRSFVRFDYSGHGASGGRFEQGTIGRWLDEAEAVFRQVARGPRVLVGSSMGGWIALLLARRLQKDDPEQARRIRGMVLLAPATDMTKDLMWDLFSEDMRQTLTHEGRIAIPSEYGPEPYVITKTLIEEGMRHLLLEEGMSVPWPVRILQGEADADVPWRHGLKTFEALAGDDVTFTLVKNADHRLSTPRDLQMLGETVLALCARADKAARSA